MAKYYHIYPTCPACHEPHVSGSTICKIDGENFRCSSCSAIFLCKIDILSGEFTNTINAIKDNEDGKTEKYLSSIPLVWEVRASLIEDEYIQWIKETNAGNFLVTWPWRKVKFIPVLCYEYLILNPGKKVVIVGDISTEHSDGTKIGIPTMKEVFDNLIYLKESKNEATEGIREEMKQFDRKFVLKKKKMIHYVIDRVGKKHRVDDFADQNIRKCRSQLVHQIEKDFGESSIRYVCQRKMGHEPSEPEIVNPSGFIDIRLEEKDLWTGKLRYRKEWLWTLLLNSKDIIRLKRMIPNEILTVNDLKEVSCTGDDNLFFISSEMPPYTLFNLIEQLHPDLVLIQDADFFSRDYLIREKRGIAFSDFLKDNKEKIVLMFSVDPSIRHIYGINRASKFAEEHNIIPHTWDSEILIEKIRKELEDDESVYPNPVFSRSEELSKSRGLPDVEFIKIESLDSLDSFVDKSATIILNKYVLEDIKLYINELKRSPLFVRGIKGDYEKPEAFKRKGISLERMMTYDYIMSMFYDILDDENEIKPMIEVIDKIYNSKLSKPTNPLLEKIIEIVASILKDEGNFITVIVHRWDVRGTERLLCEAGFSEFLPRRLSISHWGDLHLRELQIKNNYKHHVITLLPPSIYYPIYFSHVKKFIFIGSENNINKMKIIINNRLDEISSKPLYFLSERDSAPALLKSVMRDIEIPSNQIIQDISGELEFDFKYSYPEAAPSKMDRIRYSHIRPGEHAVLVTDMDRKTMLIPMGASLFLKDGSKLIEIQLDDISPGEMQTHLENREILIDKKGVYVSFRSIFIQFMVANGKHVIFRRGPYEWKGFQNLFQDAIRWISMLQIAIKEYSIKYRISFEEAENRLAEHLASLDLTAKDSEYIRGWWSNYEILPTEFGEKYLFKVDHTKKLEDMKKIYKFINKILPDMNIDPETAELSYFASITIQSLRRSLLKGEKKDISPSMHPIYIRLEREVRKIIETSPTFRVILANVVEITIESEPFRIMNDYEKHIQIS